MDQLALLQMDQLALLRSQWGDKAEVWLNQV
jgi:hypothetical protein